MRLKLRFVADYFVPKIKQTTAAFARRFERSKTLPLEEAHTILRDYVSVVYTQDFGKTGTAMVRLPLRVVLDQEVCTILRSLRKPLTDETLRLIIEIRNFALLHSKSNDVVRAAEFFLRESKRMKREGIIHEVGLYHEDLVRNKPSFNLTTTLLVLAALTPEKIQLYDLNILLDRISSLTPSDEIKRAIKAARLNS